MASSAAATGGNDQQAQPPPITRQPSANKKFTVDDFEYGGMLGEGSYAKVLYSKLKSSGREFAIKMVDKNFVRRHNKIDEMMNEKKMLSLIDHPLCVKLHSTFQDEFSLYYVLDLAVYGELFHFIQRMGKVPSSMTQFFIAELVLVLEYLHRKHIIHRDLKPENILISASGHIKLTDFATSKLVTPSSTDGSSSTGPGGTLKRKKSFVGTAEYVSPEVLEDGVQTTSMDMWALGCIIFQMLTGKPPFKGESEYLTFQSILGGQVEYPSYMQAEAVDLIKQLLVLDPTKRLGANVADYHKLKSHPFFAGIAFDSIVSQPPPDEIIQELSKVDITMRIAPESKSVNSDDEENSITEPFEMVQVSGSSTSNTLGNQPTGSSSGALSVSPATVGSSPNGSIVAPGSPNLTSRDRTNTPPVLSTQIRAHAHSRASVMRAPAVSAAVAALRRSDDDWKLVVPPPERIVFMGLVQKRRLPFTKTRQLILTNQPRLIYVDAETLVVKGTIPWTETLWAEVKSDKVFYIHTPNRYYYMRALECPAKEWVETIMQFKAEHESTVQRNKFMSSRAQSTAT